jgi:hypothetical protein
MSFTGSYGTGDYDACLIKIDKYGDKEWDKTFGGIKNDYVFSIQQTSDEGYIFTGLTSSYSNDTGDVWLFKLEPDGGFSDVVINEIIGGFRLSAVIKNIGNASAYDVPWSIDLEGGWIPIGGHSNDILDVLDPGQETTVRERSLFGIGHNVEITVMAGDSSKKALASWILGPLVLGVSDIS